MVIFCLALAAKTYKRTLKLAVKAGSVDGLDFCGGTPADAAVSDPEHLVMEREMATMRSVIRTAQWQGVMRMRPRLQARLIFRHLRPPSRQPPAPQR